MCLLAVCNTEKIPKENFLEAAKRNSDGIGFAWFKDNKVYFNKGWMIDEQAYEYYDTIDIFPHVVHFRLGSPTSNLLTHPFIVSKDSPLILEGAVEKVLFHNGILSYWRDAIIPTMLATKKVLEGEIIDTRLAAVWVSMLGNEILNCCSGKFAVMYGKDKSIEFFGEFKEDKGVMYSNESYKVSKVTYYQQRSQSNVAIPLFNGYDTKFPYEMQEFII